MSLSTRTSTSLPSSPFHILSAAPIPTLSSSFHPPPLPPDLHSFPNTTLFRSHYDPGAGEWASLVVLGVSSMYVDEKIGRAHVELQSRFDLVCRLLLEKKKREGICLACVVWVSLGKRRP